MNTKKQTNNSTQEREVVRDLLDKLSVGIRVFKYPKDTINFIEDIFDGEEQYCPLEDWMLCYDKNSGEFRIYYDAEIHEVNPIDLFYLDDFWTKYINNNKILIEKIKKYDKMLWSVSDCNNHPEEFNSEEDYNNYIDEIEELKEDITDYFVSDIYNDLSEYVQYQLDNFDKFELI